MSRLNPPQQAAIHYLDGPLLVLAGAGSGKTRVITEKLAYLLQTCGYQPENMFAVTFTNKAAKEMRSRIKKLLPNQNLKKLTISTFHSLGLTILKAEHTFADLKPRFSIFDSQDSQALLQQLIEQEAASLPVQADLLHYQISRWKNALINPEQAASMATNPGERLYASLYQMYDKSLRAYNAVDFDDLIYLPVQLLQQASICDRWQSKVHYLLVDEYQDTNSSQYELVKLLVGQRQALTVVGDDHQSIYTWRGAQPENLQLLQTDYPNLNVIKLEQNYRSLQRILRSANHLIANNSMLFEKNLWSDMGLGDPIRIIACDNAEAEAQQVVMELLTHKLNNRNQFNDYAILYRSNHQAQLFEKMLREHDIPYQISGGQSFFSKTEIKDMLAYLRIITNPDDDAALIRIINTPRRGIGPTTVTRLGEFAKQQLQPMLAAIRHPELSNHIQGRSLAGLQKLADWLSNLQKIADTDGKAALETLWREVNYEDWLIAQSNTPKSAEVRIKNTQDLYGWLIKMLENTDKYASLHDAVGQLCLLDQIEQRDAENLLGVQLSTLHAAKGLEFPHVYMVGMEENILPHRNSIEADNIEEERRLCYVGITRAQRGLCLSFAKQRKRHGELVDCEPSRFLTELPKDETRWPDATNNESTRLTTGKSHLASLKNLLS